MSIYSLPYYASHDPLRIRVKEFREKKGWSQARLAEESGVRQATISDLETSASTRIEFRVLEGIARALGMDPRDLFEVNSVSKRKRPAPDAGEERVKGGEDDAMIPPQSKRLPWTPFSSTSCWPLMLGWRPTARLHRLRLLF